MALLPCRECGQEISASAEACPHCGVSNPGTDEVAADLGKWATLIFRVVMAGFAIYSLGIIAQCSANIARISH